MQPANTEFIVGDAVRKVTGDYTFTGIVVAVLRKRDNRSIRYVVENDDGVLMIMSARQLEKAT